MTDQTNGYPPPVPLLPHHRPEPAPSGSGEPPRNSEAVGRLRQHLRDTLGAELPQRVEAQERRTGAAVTREARRELARVILDGAVAAHSEAELMNDRPLVGRDIEQRVITEVVNELFGLAGLQPLLDDLSVETINANRFDRVFVQYNDGRRAQVAPIAATNEELTDLVRLLAARASSQERRFDHGSPAVNLQLPGGERLFAVMGLTAGGVTALSIRRHGYLTVTLPELRARGTIDPGLEQFLRAMVRARKNILITGGTGAGKTTLLRALASEMDPMERIVTIEDAFELGLELDPEIHADVTAFQAREANVEGEGAISQAELVRYGLRMSPDRVIVGEVRGPELVPMLNAMSQGNDGSMATLHASSSRIAFTRLASYAAQGPERLTLEATNLMVASAVHFVVHLARGLDRATRVVSSIREVVGADGPQIVSNEVYRPGTDRRARPVAGALRTDTLDDLIDVGFHPDVLEEPDGWWHQ
ncbi:Pilus assembly protein, ATPase of CpaF family [Actinokineospora alba]|uniref:Pilus assembly protein, ATPase of CpaF family n=1 Tax=Actinokineospora alba TaxID=504798 RepID=A0A1H0LC45_9PSEU|nr:ATPase, T2SS/T4P/T4SS family [Actinokineospora alba]TDP67274.1 Flp pilus assembly CpaF family ATPase [Actinokineospora alba]SDJ01953.1 Pilus assembly protein, ATPase of CpaF family [Actinokineospora alba]SDO65819.1 Pilus assembly protein, ATPase of CpaF family [Actinokineospora alba]